MDGYALDPGVLAVIAIVGGGWVFLTAAGGNISRRIRNRTRRTDEQALAACVRRHPSSQPAHIPGPRRQP